MHFWSIYLLLLYFHLPSVMVGFSVLRSMTFQRLLTLQIVILHALIHVTVFLQLTRDIFKNFGLRRALVDLTPRLTWEHWIYGNYNAAPYPAEFLWNTRQRLHVNVIVVSQSGARSLPDTLSLSYIRNDYFLCKSMNEIRATGTYTCHVPPLYLYTGCS